MQNYQCLGKSYQPRRIIISSGENHELNQMNCFIIYRFQAENNKHMARKTIKINQLSASQKLIQLSASQ